MKQRCRRSLVIASCLGLVPALAGATPLISEIFYDAVGSDDGLSFVELYGAPGASLDGLVLEAVNGSNGDVTHSLELSGVIPADGFFVVADSMGSGPTLVANADLVLNFDFQNGPDSVLLRSDISVLDAVGYGEFADGDVFAGEGAAAPDADAGSSLARRFANLDSDDNAFDFLVLSEPTPGSGPLASVPEPGSAMLLASALALLTYSGRRRTRARPALR